MLNFQQVINKFPSHLRACLSAFSLILLRMPGVSEGHVCMLQANPEKDLEGVFSIFDKSGDGLIQTDDLRNAIKVCIGATRVCCICCSMLSQQSMAVWYQNHSCLLVLLDVHACTEYFGFHSSIGHQQAMTRFALPCLAWFGLF